LTYGKWGLAVSNHYLKDCMQIIIFRAPLFIGSAIQVIFYYYKIITNDTIGCQGWAV
jgi:hypothetical protein